MKDKESGILQRLSGQIADDAEALDRYLSLIAASGRVVSREEYKMLEAMMSALADRVIFEHAPLRYRVTVGAQIRKEVAKKPRKGLSKALLYRHLATVAEEAWDAKAWVLEHKWTDKETGKRYGWRGRVAALHQVQWRTIEKHLPEWDSTIPDLEEWLRNWRKPPKP